MIFLIQLILLLLSTFSDSTIVKDENPYTKGYFSFPINPGVQTSLSGTFGDIRINHFHAGLDIRTGGVEGKSVYAAAEGYVSRIKIARGGYGNGLYITHPNGLTTVYGHLKEFSKRLKDRLTAEQYNKETWEIDLTFQPGELPVKKGEMVAISGNTGGSGGPHLHFEIRDKDENTLDPALFGFREIKDNQAPRIEFITLKCLSKNARINGHFGSFDYPVTMSKTGEYFLTREIEVWGDIGLELYAYDKAETSPFKLGLKEINVSMNGVSCFNYHLDKMPFYNKIDMNIHTDYERMVEQNKKLHKGYFETGNTLDFYQYDNNLGVLHFAEEKSNKIAVKLNDTFGNQRLLNFNLTSKETPSLAVSNTLSSQKTKVSVYESLVKITTRKSDEPLILLDGTREKVIEADLKNASEQNFIIDLNEDFFSKYSFEGVVYDLPLNFSVSPEKNTISSKDFEIDFGKQLFHKIPIEVKVIGNKLKIHEDILPLKGHFDVKWHRSLTNIDTEKDRVYWVSGSKPKYVGGNWTDSGIDFKPKEFGTFEVLRDNQAPSITVRTVSPSKLVFRIDDSLSGIASFECFVNGKWVLMEYEYKNGLIWSEKLDNEPFSGELILNVIDNCNNIKTYKTTI